MCVCVEQVMRAMGHKVTQPQLDEIFSLCDPQGLGEIDFESFCTNVLGFPADRALRLARAHLDRPIGFDPASSEGPESRPVPLDQLLPDLCARVAKEREAAEEARAAANDGGPAQAGSLAEPAPAPAPAQGARREALFVWQDFGQYTRAQLSSERIGRTDLLRILSRPFAITMHKGAMEVSCSAALKGSRMACLGAFMVRATG